MSEMSQAQGPPGGDPVDLVGGVGSEDDVLPGPPANLDEVEEADQDAGRVMEVDTDPAPDSGATLDPPGSDVTDPDAGADPLDSADTEGMRPPGAEGSESGSDPMPDMSGTTE